MIPDENNFPLATFLINIHHILKQTIMKILKKFHKLTKNRLNMSKNSFLFTLLIALISTATYAQTASGFGFKAGLNYNANGNYFESASNNAQHPDRNVGFHFGVFGKFGKELYFKTRTRLHKH